MKNNKNPPYKELNNFLDSCQLEYEKACRQFEQDKRNPANRKFSLNKTKKSLDKLIINIEEKIRNSRSFIETQPFRNLKNLLQSCTEICNEIDDLLLLNQLGGSNGDEAKFSAGIKRSKDEICRGNAK